MTPYDLESLVDDAYARAGLRRGELVPPTKLARLLGYEVHFVPNMRTMGSRARLEGRKIIGVRSSLLFAGRQHTTGHELGHELLEEAGVGPHEYTEEDCDYLGAAMVIPRRCVRDDAQALALSHKTSETLALLRIGEVLGEPVAVVAPLTVRARGEAQWPEPSVLRSWSRRPRPGLRAVRLQDDRQRIALRTA